MSPLIYLVAGTRPNFMKIAPVYRALHRRGLPIRTAHTGQHFDTAMSDVFYEDLDMPPPDLRLQVGGGSHAELTAATLLGIERDLVAHHPTVVVVVGDVTSTLAAALAASKLGIAVAHVEAGLRSRDWTMPEEINRVLTDRLSDLLLIPSFDARDNLIHEGIEPERIVFVGNVMIDSLHHALAKPTDVLSRFGLRAKDFAVVTLHRPANVDEPEALHRTLDALDVLAERIRVLFPIHPRTKARLEAFGALERLQTMDKVILTEPLGYRDFVTLVSCARVAATDSGGIQEETTALGIPCLTMREGTERPVTVTDGTNVVVGLRTEQIRHELDSILAGRGKRGRIPDGWDGRAGERIVDAIDAFVNGSPPPKTAYRPS